MCLHPPQNGASERAGAHVYQPDRVSLAEKQSGACAIFPRARHGPAVVLLPNWNAKWHGQVNLCRWLNKLGITVLRLSLPYHDRRVAPGHERADQLVGSNIGLTLQATRQAITDTRRCLRWLEQQGYGKLGLVGTSIGSAVGSITMAHDRAVRAGAFHARLHIFRRRGAHGNDHRARVGGTAHQSDGGRVAALLDADQPVCRTWTDCATRASAC